MCLAQSNHHELIYFEINKTGKTNRNIAIESDCDEAEIKSMVSNNTYCYCCFLGSE